MSWALLDTADTSTLLNTDSNVTFFSPSGGPGVLNDPVSRSAFGTVSDNKDGVVKGSSACGSIGNNTTGILMEDWLVSFNGNRNWSSLKGGVEEMWLLRLDGLPVGNSNKTLRLIVLAIEESRGCVIWIVSLGLEWVIFCIHVSKNDVTAVASVVQPRAIDKVTL